MSTAKGIDMLIDHTNGRDDDDTCKVFIIRDSGTIYGLLSFDSRLEAIDAARRYDQPVEVEWAKVLR
jgi:hypothetical protein